MNDEVLVKAEGVSKKFCRNLKRSLWYGLKDISTELLGLNSNGQLRKEEFWAVNDVSFELRRGECLGLIGHNGAGKSTLLKMLNGLIKPDRGKITMKGRIGALIELGAGFNPILTGRENIYSNGSVLGFSKRDIAKKFDAIVDFAEIEEFIDTPVQNYSSGMKVRLGFAVAAQMEPDVLIIDEVLAVGDVGFRAKCLSRIGELQNTCAIIFVSHSMSMVSRISTMILHLDKGRISFQGKDMAKGINQFLCGFTNEKFKAIGDPKDIEFKELKINNKEAFQGETLVKQYEDIVIDFKFKPKTNAEIFGVTFSLADQELKGIAGIMDVRNQAKYKKEKGIVHVRASFKSQLAPGRFYLTIYLNKFDNGRAEYLLEYRQITTLIVEGESFFTAVPIQFDSNFEGTIINK